MILVFGKSGQVARELQRQSTDSVFLDRSQADLSEPKKAAGHILEIKPNVVINAAAYTAVDKAEDETQLAHTINGDAVGAMGQACASLDIPLVHISTDYVFPGGGTALWLPSDNTGPIGAYGASKLAGEIALQTSGVRHVTLRTSWVFSAFGNNFVKTMLKYGAERPELTVVADQIGGPTPAAGIANACLRIAEALTKGQSGGTYHYSGAPDVSWADFAKEIMAQAALPAKITDIPTSDYPTPAARPLNSRMDCTSLMADFGIDRPDWRQGLADVLKELEV